jgi:hypothetical protein
VIGIGRWTTEPQFAGGQLELEALRVNRFQQSRTESAMDFNRGAENLSGDIVERGWVDVHLEEDCKFATDHN